MNLFALRRGCARVVVGILLAATGIAPASAHEDDAPPVEATAEAVLPADAAEVADRLESCLHFAGEFNGDGSERDEYINLTMTELRCDIIKADVEAMRAKYPDDEAVQSALARADDL